MSLIIFDMVDDEGRLPGEDRQVVYLQQPPAEGDRVTLGGSRLWTVAAVDAYSGAAGFVEPIYLAHCYRGILQPREQWWLAEECQDSPNSLRVYLLDGELKHWSVSLDGSEPETKVLLPLFNPGTLQVTPQDIGVETLSEYRPQQGLEHPCYRSIWVGQCVQVPHTPGRRKEALQTA